MYFKKYAPCFSVDYYLILYLYSLIKQLIQELNKNYFPKNDKNSISYIYLC